MDTKMFTEPDFEFDFSMCHGYLCHQQYLYRR